MIAIIKGVGSHYIKNTVKALFDGGIRVVEITLNSADALKSITAVRETMRGKMVCGAGTVMTDKTIDDAAGAGAQFISCIHSDSRIIAKISELDKAIIAGAFTPTNIITAKEFGADFINIFPSITLGPDYFKQIKSPFCDQFFFAVGGINTENAARFLKAGAGGIGIGNNLVNPRFIRENNFDAIKEAAAKYVEIVKSFM
ncbi:MAG: 2-dehydro-3-deoxy-6-phosphogalactonate aldolase [Ruminiclostridium sp.]|nr:2-dehydro-3-deoxy-6-phosphogalactonate aldolase [Ruminiclostridium sp.]